MGVSAPAGDWRWTEAGMDGRHGETSSRRECRWCRCGRTLRDGLGQIRGYQHAGENLHGLCDGESAEAIAKKSWSEIIKSKTWDAI
jgi:hypothetical protein